MQQLNNIRVHTKILSVVALVLVLNIIVAIAVYFSILNSQQREADVAFTYQVLEQIDEVHLNVERMLSAERGFVIAGDEALLQYYNESIVAYERIRDELRAALETRDEELEQQQLIRVDEIDAAVQDLRDSALEPIIQMRRDEMAGERDFDEISEFLASGVGTDRINAIEEQFVTMRQAEQDVLETRREQSLESAQTLQIVLIGGTALSVIAGFFAALVVAGSIARRVDQVAIAATRMADGHLDEQHPLPEGRDEVGVMATAFQRMSSTIRTQMSEQQRYNEELRAANEARVAREYLEEVVRDYSTFASQVAQGNLSARLSVNGSGDELSLLGHDLNRMVEGLHSITSQVQQASNNMASAAAQILSATTQQAASTSEQSSAITQTSTTIEEVKTIARQLADQANQVVDDSQSAISAAQEGTHTVESTIDSMTQIRSRVESIAQTIMSLAEQTRAIGAITQTVSELADQSNLLALNAAIEAARAGEQGRSFAVVAQNVRELAERSKAATEQVREILQEIQRATNAAVLVTEEGTRGVEEGTHMAANAGQVIHRIASEIESGAQANTQMAAAAHQQTAGMEQIGQAMISIQQAMSQTTASTRQAEQAAKDLHTLAQSLQDTISSYHL